MIRKERGDVSVENRKAGSKCPISVGGKVYRERRVTSKV